ncbi:entry exclusion protein TrbK [Agrobacterium pusense]|uniref:entry exclusion protein TrbK n=1 Tax=Agrobacterium pusense TaxID=648995 RepID=UPI0032DB62C0
MAAKRADRQGSGTGSAGKVLQCRYQWRPRRSEDGATLVSRAVVIAIALSVAVASVSAATVFIMKSDERSVSKMSEKFFGVKKDLPPIEKGQEMRPRW